MWGELLVTEHSFNRNFEAFVLFFFLKALKYQDCEVSFRQKGHFSIKSLQHFDFGFDLKKTWLTL